MVSSGVMSRSVSSTNWGLSGPSPGLLVVDQGVPLAATRPAGPATGPAASRGNRAASEPGAAGAPGTASDGAPPVPPRVASEWARPRPSRATSSSSITSRQSPAMATSARRTLWSSAGSMSTWMTLAPGAKASDPAGHPVVEPAARGRSAGRTAAWR